LDNDDTIDINDSDDDILVDTDDDITAEVNNRIEYMSSHIQRMYPDMSNNNYEMPSLHATVDAAILDSNSLNEVISSTQDVISFVQQALNNIDLSNELEPVPPIQH